MTEQNWTTLFMILGNCFLFGMVGYAVFILGFSGWWFALPICVHFSLSDFKDKA